MMLRTALPSVFCLMLLAAPLARADGELMVMPARLKVFNGHEYGVTVRNVGDAPLYLSISLLKVMNPGQQPEEKVPLSQLEHPSVLANTDKLTLGPGQSRSIGLKSLAVPVSEEMYRLYIVPVKAMHVDEAPQDKITAPMSVAIAYGVLIQHMPPPANQRASWSHRCEKEGVTLENTGNVRIFLSDVSSPGNKQERDQMALYPGITQHFPAKPLTMRIDDSPQTFNCRG
ncbi:pilus assembly protein [Achromobacter sp. SD115]|uniref:pilus assembly protein n=1 Tax=Achromobacter sp. SD115 TaxID=2782011 RepID=UPI001A9781CA|nr:pilus assembly protein [Achromobacter sp. SD115]MBO1016337.1 pilus assembly protein [Achromobacter sp. SD115]